MDRHEVSGFRQCEKQGLQGRGFARRAPFRGGAETGRSPTALRLSGAYHFHPPSFVFLGSAALRNGDNPSIRPLA